MSYIILGLGNPGEEYITTRHNTGRIVLESIRKHFDFPEWQVDKRSQSLISKNKIKKQELILVEPETFMNKSGKAAAAFIKNQKQAEKLVVIQDDLDLPIGSGKFSFNRGSGGHRGIESIIRAIKTEGFIRIRIGISPVTPSGKLKKPVGGKAVEAHILGEFKKPELDALKKVSKKAAEAIEILLTDGREVAMGAFNS